MQQLLEVTEKKVPFEGGIKNTSDQSSQQHSFLHLL